MHIFNTDETMDFNLKFLLGNIFKLVIFLFITFYAEISVAEYSLQKKTCIGGNDDSPVDSILSPIGIACFRDDYSIYQHESRVANIGIEALIVNIGNTADVAQKELLKLKKQLNELQSENLALKAENIKWRAEVLQSAFDRIDRMPQKFADSDAFRKTLAPLIVEEIRKNPDLLFRLKKP